MSAFDTDVDLHVFLVDNSQRSLFDDRLGTVVDNESLGLLARTSCICGLCTHKLMSELPLKP
jgi:hypothetical protein